MHNNDIIHGICTSSKHDCPSDNGDFVFIDFWFRWLFRFNEYKATDLLVLKNLFKVLIMILQSETLRIGWI